MATLAQGVRGRGINAQPQHDHQAMQRDAFEGQGQRQHAGLGAWDDTVWVCGLIPLLDTGLGHPLGTPRNAACWSGKLRCRPRKRE